MVQKLSSTSIVALLVVGLSLVVSAWLAPAHGNLAAVIGLFGVSSLSLAGLIAMGGGRI